MMVITARSSMRVKAATGRRGVKGLRGEGIKEETRRFWILDFGLAEEIGSRQGRKAPTQSG